MKTNVITITLILGMCHAVRSSAMSCYVCSLKEQCFEFDSGNSDQWRECEPGTTHCVKETTVSAVTGVVVVNRMCGGEVYIAKNTPLSDGCYDLVKEDVSRINATKCYCSTDYCNTAMKTTELNTTILILTTVAAVLTATAVI